MLEAFGRNGYFKVARIETWGSDTMSYLGAYSKRAGKGTPLMLSGPKDELAAALTNALESITGCHVTLQERDNYHCPHCGAYIQGKLPDNLQYDVMPGILEKIKRECPECGKPVTINVLLRENWTTTITKREE